MNKVIMCGRITKEPDVRYTTGEKQTAIANFSMAINRKVKRDGQPDADFFNFTAFGKTAEIVEKYCTKGMKLIVTGSLQNDTYEKNGEKKTSTKIYVEEIEFAESKSSNTSSESAEPKDASGNPYPKFSGNNGFMNAVDPSLDSELPFA